MIIQGTRLVALLAAWIFLALGCSSGAVEPRSRAEFEAGIGRFLGVDLDKIPESETQALKNLGLTGEFMKDSEQAMTVGNRLHGMRVVVKVRDHLISYLFYEDTEHVGPNWGFKLFLNYREDGSFAGASGMRLIYPGNEGGTDRADR